MKIKNCHLLTLFSKLNIESEHINEVNKTKNYHSILIFLCFHQSLDKKSRSKLFWVANKAARSARICPWLPTTVAPQVDPRLNITLPTVKLELQISPWLWVGFEPIEFWLPC